jgi:hypothetical protein
MITHTSIWDQKLGTRREAGICKIIFPWWDEEICETGIIVDCGVSCRTLPATEDVDKYQIPSASCQAILCNTALAISSSMALSSCGSTVEMGPIHGTESIRKKWEEFGVIPDLRWNRITGIWQVNIVGIERGG